MNVSRAMRAAVAALPVLAATACLSSSPPAPPVRYFDPLPAPGALEPARGPGPNLRVFAASHLSGEFVVRVGTRELARDGAHHWLVPPAELVATALARALGSSADPAGPTVRIDVDAFELDVSGAPTARVALYVQSPVPEFVNGLVVAEARAADGSPAALAAAMASALVDVARQVRR